MPTTQASTCASQRAGHLDQPSEGPTHGQKGRLRARGLAWVHPPASPDSSTGTGPRSTASAASALCSSPSAPACGTAPSTPNRSGSCWCGTATAASAPAWTAATEPPWSPPTSPHRPNRSWNATPPAGRSRPRSSTPARPSASARPATAPPSPRTVPLGLLTYRVVTAWYVLVGHHPTDTDKHRARARWYTTRTQPSSEDMTTEARRTITRRHEVRACGPRTGTTPPCAPAPAVGAPAAPRGRAL